MYDRLYLPRLFPKRNTQLVQLRKAFDLSDCVLLFGLFVWSNTFPKISPIAVTFFCSLYFGKQREFVWLLWLARLRWPDILTGFLVLGKATVWKYKWILNQSQPNSDTTVEAAVLTTAVLRVVVMLAVPRPACQRVNRVPPSGPKKQQQEKNVKVSCERKAAWR